MRLAGLLLLLLGFVWSLCLPDVLEVCVAAAASAVDHELPLRESYPRDEVHDAIWAVSPAFKQFATPLVWASRFLVLGGGLLLFFGRKKSPPLA